MHPEFTIRWLFASLPKSSHQAEENEDAVFPSLHNGSCITDSFFQCAVADGATQSSFSKVFARSLVKTSSTSPKSSTLPDVINQARSVWQDSVGSLQLPWPASEKVHEGAYSTILWLRFFPQGTGKYLWKNIWKAHAIGDTCLFLFRQEHLIHTLPLSKSAEFHNHPALIGSKNSRIQNSEDWEFSGTWEKGDDFFIGTDAISKWILQQVEMGRNPGIIIKDRLARKSEPSYFDHWIHSLRKRKEIRDDDTTIVWIKIL